MTVMQSNIIKSGEHPRGGIKQIVDQSYHFLNVATYTCIYRRKFYFVAIESILLHLYIYYIIGTCTWFNVTLSNRILWQTFSYVFSYQQQLKIEMFVRFVSNLLLPSYIKPFSSRKRQNLLG